MLYLEKDTSNSFSALQGQLSHYSPGPKELVDWDLNRSVVIPPIVNNDCNEAIDILFV